MMFFNSEEQKKAKREAKAKKELEKLEQVERALEELKGVIKNINEKQKREDQKLSLNKYDDAYLESLLENDDGVVKELIIEIQHDRSIEKRSKQNLDKRHIYLMLLFTGLIAIFTILDFLKN